MNSKGCSFLENGINFERDKVTDCCISHNDGRGLPLIFDNWHGEKIDWNKLFEIKEARVNAQMQNTIYDCENCYRLTDYKFKHERKISEFHFTHCRLCNAKCIYCSDDYHSGCINYDVYEIIKDLKANNLYAPGGEATFQGGEPTLMQNFDNLVSFFKENGTAVRIHTSGIKFSQSVADTLAENKGHVVISLDSGSKETYFKLKQVNCFNIVVDNIFKYAVSSKENVILKYIIVPGYNDNLEEIDSFFKIVRDAGIKTVALDIEVRYARKHENKNVSPHIFLLADYFYKVAARNNIEVLTYSFISYVLKNRKIKPSFLINIKLLYSLLINIKRDKTKNYDY